MKKHLFSDFTNQYSLQKTLRFELKPIGKTSENIEKMGFISQDNQRAEDYKEVKKVIDLYHKQFIDSALSNVELENLKDYYEIFIKSDSDKKDLNNIKEKLRKQIAKSFAEHQSFKTLFKSELIKKDLIDFVETEEGNIELVKKFQNFTTYFSGFHKNRENMYSSDDKSTAIAFRLIHDNLPKFIENILVYKKIKENAPELITLMEKALNNIEEVVQGKTLDEIFSLNYFNETLTQNGIELYNTIIGGRSEKNDKIKGLNECINTDYNQKQNDKNKRMPKFKQLYKQILSDRNTVSFIAEGFEDDNEVLEGIEKFYQNEICNFESDGQTINILTAILNLISNLSNFDLRKIYIRNDKSLTDISQNIFGDWSIISSALNEYYNINNPKHTKETEIKFEERRENWVKRSDYFDIATIQKALYNFDFETDINKEQNFIVNYFAKLGIENNGNNNTKNLFEKIAGEYENIKDLLNVPYPDDKQLVRQKGENSDVEKIKNFLDSIMNIIHFIKPLDLKDESKEKDLLFYNLFKPLYDQIGKTILLYNRVRNYVTKKPYSTEKIKLNFENSHLLSGWAQDYETKGALIFTKDNNYYLGIIEKKFTDSDKNFLTDNYNANQALRIIYDFQKPDNKNIPRLFIRSKGDSYAPAVSEYNLPINKIINIYDEGKFKTEYRKNNPEEYKKSLIALIDYFKIGFSKHESYKHFDFKWKESSKYNDISEFYHDVEHSCYRLLTEKINFDTLLKYTDEGKLYLFQIYNKDFSPYSKGKPNLHTIYWKMLFDENNLKDVVLKLNGQSEIFYRQKSIKENIIVHKAHQAIDNKNPDNKRKQSIFKYDIVKNKRFTIDKFQFHVPITLNFKSSGRDFINEKVNKFLKNNPDVNIIGIDRGERHLVYYSIINQQGEIIEHGSLNEITNNYNGDEYKTDYHEKLEIKEGERDKARKTWDTIGTIKELKEGYISQVVHKIAQLMIKHNAIVVFEDLNFGFKRGRQKVEKQVYQKLEKMLIDKLNFLVFKDYEANEPGGILRAFQLANKFDSFEKLGKQSGFIFYVQAALTSKIDPITGFVDFLKPKYESISKAIEFFSKFDRISYNIAKDFFEFAFDYNNYTTKAEGTRTSWVVCTHGDVRYRYNPQTKSSEEVNVTKEIKELLAKFGIQYQDGKCFKSELLLKEEKALFSKLIHLLSLTLSLRHSKSGTDIDFILSPVANISGDFYDSRNAGDLMPKDADSNGAYHIALKGLLSLNIIYDTPDEELKKPDLKITNKDWLVFAQNR